LKCSQTALLKSRTRGSQPQNDQQTVLNLNPSQIDFSIASICSHFAALKETVKGRLFSSLFGAQQTDDLQTFETINHVESQAKNYMGNHQPTLLCQRRSNSSRSDR
jgi:hypothetical protein